MLISTFSRTSVWTATYVAMLLQGLAASVVLATPRIAVEPERIEFGAIQAGGRIVHEITISNEGDEMLSVERIDSDQNNFGTSFIGARRFEASPFEYVRTDVSHTILVLESSVDGEPLDIGSDIAVLTPNGVCGGVTRVEEADQELGIAAWADDRETEEIDGFQSDEPIIFHFWDVNSLLELEAAVEYVQGPETFQSNGVTVVRLAANSNAVTGNIDPDSSIRVSVYFSPDEIADYRGVLTIVSNDPDSQQVYVRLTGSGTAGNVAPDVATPLQDIAIEEDHGELLVADLNEVFQDQDGDQLEFSCLGSPSLNLEIRDGHLFYLTPKVNFFGSDLAVRVTAVDPEGDSVSDNFQVDVAAINDAPYWAEIPEVRRFEIAEGEGLTFHIIAADTADDGEEIEYRLENLGGLEGARLVPTGASGVDFILSADFESEGEYRPRFVASDGEAEISFSVDIVIEHTNQRMIVANPIEGLTLTEDTNRNPLVDLDSIVVDPDGDAVFFDLVASTAELGVTLDQRTGVLSTRLADNWNGVGEVTVVGLQNMDQLEYTFSITVTAVNDFPEITGRGLTTVDEGDTLRVELWGIDIEDGVIWGVRLTQRIGLPDRAQFIEGTPGFLYWVTSYSDAGRYEAVFAVRDSDGEARSYLFDIRVNEVNPPPVVAHRIPDITIREDAGVRVIADLDTVFSSLDGESLSYSLTASNDLGLAISQANILSCRCVDNFNSRAGELIVITAQDSTNQIARDSLVLIVTPVNDAPSPFGLVGPANHTTIDTTGYRVTFQWQSAADVDHDTVRYSWTLSCSSQRGDTAVTIPCGTVSAATIRLDSLVYKMGFYTEHDPMNIEATWWVRASDGIVATRSTEQFVLTIPAPTSVDNDPETPGEFLLSPVYPNPVNSMARISYTVPQASQIEMKLYDLNGHQAAKLYQGSATAGQHTLVWDAAAVPTGVYYLKLSCGRTVATQKIVVVK